MGWVLERKQGRRLTGSSGIPTVAGQNNSLMNHGEKFTEQSRGETRLSVADDSNQEGVLYKVCYTQ